MTDTSDLNRRIDTEFSAVQARIQALQAQQVQDYQDRIQRLERFTETLEQLPAVWRPRLELLAQRFGDRAQVTPKVESARREASFMFQSDLARIRLRFSASTDLEATRAVFSYDLEVIPVLMKFEAHSELEFPIDAIDPEALGRWMDDRIVAFVRTYFSLHENEHYLKSHMVEDPIARVRFPKYAAGATLEWKGTTYYFINEETRREFEKERGIAGAP